MLTRSRRIGTCDSPCDAFIERTIYDGDQVLAEIRSSGATGTSGTYLEGEGSVAPGGTADLYGIVLYAHAQGIDAPSHILKKVPSSTWKSVTPHADWRGVYSYGTLANGTTCTTVSAICPAWPGYQTSAYGELPGVGPTEYSVWVGNLVRGRRDASGLTYLRNRYYDSNTGRFTQMDPIGLAGGLNLYGYAGGDPINFSDPFGLCKGPKGEDLPPEQCRDQTAAEGSGAVARARLLNAVIRKQGITYSQGRGTGTLDCSQYVCANLGHPHADGANDLTSAGIIGSPGDYRPLGAEEAPQIGDVMYQPNSRGGHVGLYTGSSNDKGRPLGCAMGEKSKGSCTSEWGPGGWFAGGDKLKYYRPQVPKEDN